MALNYMYDKSDQIITLKREDILKLEFNNNGLLDESGFLSNNDIYQIFDEIFIELSKNKTISNKNEKILSYVGAQPAVGKSILVDKIQKEKVNFIYIEGDSFRDRHPKSIEFKKDPDNYVNKTNFLSTSCIKLSIARCLDMGYSFILETTMRNLKDIAITTKQAKEAGFKIDFNLIITRPEYSYISTIYRHKKFIKNGLSARKVEDKIHDDAFCGLMNFTFDILLNKNNTNILKDSCKFFSRNLKELGYINFNKKQNTIDETERKKILKTIYNEIKRPPSLNELKDNFIQINYIKKTIKQNEFSKINSRLKYLNNIDDFLKNTCELSINENI